MLKNNQIFPSSIIVIDKLFLMYVFTCVVSCIFPYLMAIVMQISKRDIGGKIFLKKFLLTILFVSVYYLHPGNELLFTYFHVQITLLLTLID